MCFDALLHDVTSHAGREEIMYKSHKMRLVFQHHTISCIHNIIRSYLKPRKFTLIPCPHVCGPLTILQMILKHCGAKKEETSECSEESPLSSFSLLMSPKSESSTAVVERKDGKESASKLTLPEDLPIDLRVKIVVCLIHLRQLHQIKVHIFADCLQLR